MALLTPDAFEDADEMQRQLGHANEEVSVRFLVCNDATNDTQRSRPTLSWRLVLCMPRPTATLLYAWS